MDSLTRQWVERAEYDLKSISHVLKGGRYLYVAFMCQQSLEKMLKAVVASHGKAPPFVHNLVRLAQDAQCYDEMSEEFRVLLADLNPYYIKARYGEYKQALSKVCTGLKAKFFFKKTQELSKWLKQKIK
ncbi:MAG: HEPN domain-containing protein [Deltaproteobacteria bacterium]|nr:HEPN domain-containing protein [Deltaproteobacteria bacterium]